MAGDHCPTCGKPEAEFEEPCHYLPFCSARCKNIDLGKWLGGHYVISRPLEKDPEEEEPTVSEDE